jgi:class 3 adenylate cyclase
MSSRVSVPSVYTVKGEVGSGNIPSQLNTYPKSNRYDPKDITSYFGASDFLLRMYVTTKLRYAFNKNTTIQYENRALSMMKSSFHKFLHQRLRFFSSILHVAYGCITLAILIQNSMFNCPKEPNVALCNSKSIASGIVIFILSMLNFVVTRTNEYQDASLPCRLILHVTYFLQGLTLVVVEILTPFPKYFRMSLHLAFGYSFFPLEPFIMLPMNLCLIFAYGLGCLLVRDGSGISMSRLAMNILIVFVLFVLQATAQYYRQINMMRSELSYAKSKWQQNLLVKEEENCSELLMSMLPSQIVQRLDEGKPVEPELFESVTVIFGQVCNFTKFTTVFTAVEVVSILNEVWSKFDHFSDMWDVHKVETVGEIYLAVAGCPIRSKYHAQSAANMAIDMRDTMSYLESILQGRKGFKEKMKDLPLTVRVGLNSGTVQAGVVGLQNPRYKLFGDTVNTSSRMESTCPHGKIQVSESTYELLSKSSVDQLGNRTSYKFEDRGMIKVKGKGEMHTYILLSNLIEDSDNNIVTSPTRQNSIRKHGVKHSINSVQLMHRLQNRSIYSDSYAEREKHFVRYMSIHETVYEEGEGNKYESAITIANKNNKIKHEDANKRSLTRSRTFAFRVKRILLLISKDDQSFNSQLMAELRKTRPIFDRKNWERNVRSVRMVASFFIFFTSIIAWNQYVKQQNGQSISSWETPVWFGITSPALGFYIFLSLQSKLFIKFGRLLTWILLFLLLFVFTFTSVYIIMDGTLILVNLLITLNVQLLDVHKRVVFVFLGLLPYPIICLVAPPQNLSEEVRLYRNIWGELFTCLLILFLQLFPVYSSEFFSQYSAYQKDIIHENTKQLSTQQEGKWALLSSLLPLSIAKQLMNDDRKLIAQTYKDVTVLFTDIKGFTNFSRSITPRKLVEFLNNMYSAFDDVLMDWEAYKVEILGDAYFVVCGCPEERSPTENAARATEVALILQSLMPSLTDNTGMMMRVGLHSGSVVAGVVGRKDPRFHLFGHTVLFANKMESHGMPGKVHASEATFNRLTPLIHDKKFDVEARGEIEVQGEEGLHKTYFINKSNWGREQKRSRLLKQQTERNISKTKKARQSMNLGNMNRIELSSAVLKEANAANSK